MLLRALPAQVGIMPSQYSSRVAMLYRNALKHSHSWMAAHDPSSLPSRGAAIVAKKGVHSIGGEKVWVAVLHGMVVVLAAPQQLQWRWASH